MGAPGKCEKLGNSVSCPSRLLSVVVQAGLKVKLRKILLFRGVKTEVDKLYMFTWTGTSMSCGRRDPSRPNLADRFASSDEDVKGGNSPVQESFSSSMISIPGYSWRGLGAVSFDLMTLLGVAVVTLVLS